MADGRWQNQISMGMDYDDRDGSGCILRCIGQIIVKAKGQRRKGKVAREQGPRERRRNGKGGRWKGWSGSIVEPVSRLPLPRERAVV